MQFKWLKTIYIKQLNTVESLVTDGIAEIKHM